MTVQEAEADGWIPCSRTNSVPQTTVKTCRWDEKGRRQQSELHYLGGGKWCLPGFPERIAAPPSHWKKKT